MRTVLAILGSIAVVGCTTLSTPVPVNYAGPTVQLSDSGYLENSSRGVFFSAVEINGQYINNAHRETRIASQGQGFGLVAQYTRRNVPVTPMQVKLLGSHQSAAPIQAILSAAAGTFLSVEGLVAFKPEEGRSYVVTGELKKEGSCIWIANATSKQPATEKICNK